MSRPALSATRATQVLSQLALRPDGQWTIAELSRALTINLSSLHAVLAALETEGFVRRDPVNKSYRLGPFALAIGASALQSHPSLAAAELALNDLATELDLEGFITSACGDAIVVLARVGQHRPTSPSLRVAQRVPLLPPVGGVFIAWADDLKRDLWLSRAPSAQRKPYEEILQLIRLRGFTVGLEGPERKHLSTAVRAAQSQSATDASNTLERALEELARAHYHLGDAWSAAPNTVSLIAAPVFDHRGNVEIALTLSGFAQPLSKEEIEEIGRRLRDIAIVATRASGGEAPQRITSPDAL